MDKTNVSKASDDGNPHPLTLKAAILDKVRECGEVTFAEIAKLDGCKDEGFKVWYGGNHNIVLWVGISCEALAAMNELYNEGLTQLVPCNPSAYGADALSLPVVEVRWYFLHQLDGRNTEHWNVRSKVGEDCWLPAVLRPGPEKSKKAA